MSLCVRVHLHSMYDFSLSDLMHNTSEMQEYCTPSHCNPLPSPPGPAPTLPLLPVLPGDITQQTSKTSDIFYQKPYMPGHAHKHKSSNLERGALLQPFCSCLCFLLYVKGCVQPCPWIYYFITGIIKSQPLWLVKICLASPHWVVIMSPLKD